jgi:hypothetical protein
MRKTIPAVVAAAFCITTPLLAQQQRQPATPQNRAQQPAAQPRPTGLNAILEDDQKLLSELGRRQMKTLLDHAFRKNNVPPDEQKVYLTLSSLKQLNEGAANLSRRQQQELVTTIATGIDQVLETTKDPRRMLEINGHLIKAGTVRHLNTLEYWGENTRTQSQLRPVAEAIDRMYERAITLAKERADTIANQIRDPNDALAKDWEQMTQLEAMARLNSAFNKYTLALSIDKADPRRAKVAQAGIEVLKEFEDPAYEVQNLAAGGIAKLNLAIGTKESLAAAKEKFATIIKDANAPWSVKFEAVYFTAVADLLARDLVAAQAGLANVSQWLKANPAPDEALAKGTEAAVLMLDYRIAAARAANDPSANAKAIAMLQELIKKRPDLSGIINEQLITRLPDNADVKKLDALLLRAIVARGDEEIRKPEDQPLDKKVLAQATAAARELIARVGRDGVTNEDADISTLLLGFFQSRQGQDVEAANTFLAHVEKFRTDETRRQIAFDNAGAAVAKLMRENPGHRSAADAYLRYLQIASADPFNRRELSLEYARILLQRNAATMQAGTTDAQKQQLRANAERAAALLAQVNDEKQNIHARWYEMLAHDQIVDLLPANSPQLATHVKKVQDLADEVTKLADARMQSNPAEARKFKVQTSLLAANLAKHDQGATRDKSLERALSLLADFERDVQGMPNANTLLGEALFIRVNALMSLGRADDALGDLGKFLETRSGDEGIQVVYDMLESLNKELQQAQQDGDEQRVAELAGNRARVSGYLVDRVSKSQNAQVRALLPRYRMFEAATLQLAASLEKDQAKRTEYLNQALKIFQEAQTANPSDRGIELNVALVQYDLGNYRVAQPVLARYLNEGLLGRPRTPAGDAADGSQLTENVQYWDAMHKLLHSNVQLANAKAPGYDHAKLLEETQLKLKQLYIQWGEPGGPKFVGRFDALRQQILPDWTPPTFSQAGDGAATQPVGAR